MACPSTDTSTVSSDHDHDAETDLAAPSLATSQSDHQSTPLPPDEGRDMPTPLKTPLPGFAPPLSKHGSLQQQSSSSPPIHNRRNPLGTPRPNDWRGSGARGPRRVPFERSAASRTSVPVQQWGEFASMKLKLFNLPDGTTTWEIWRALEVHTSVIFIDIFPPKRSARVQIKPPKGDPWEGKLEILRNGCKIPVNLEVDPHGFFSSHTIKSPLGNPVPSELNLQPSAVSFGYLTDKASMMVMASIHPEPQVNPDGLTFHLDFSRRRIHVYLPVAFIDNSGPEPYYPRHNYKIEVKFNHITRLFRTDVPGTNKRYVVLPLSSPPAFFRETEDIAITHSDDRLTWSQWETWRRQVHIMDDPSLISNSPLSLSEEHQSFLDLGRWTSYRLEFTDEWPAIERYLDDYGITTQIAPEFEFACPEEDPVVMWDLLRRPVNLKVPGHGLGLLDTTASSSVHLPWEVRYQLEACISHRLLPEPSITSEFLQKLADLKPSRARIMLEYLVDRKVTLYDPMKLFDDENALTYWPDITPEELPAYCTMARKATITPSIIYFNSPTVETTNRVLRHYSEHQDRFLRVQFTDELTRGRIFASQEQAVDDELFARIFRVLKNGICIGDRHYKFLAFGSSQMRENSVYFFCPTGDITCDSIRDWMGDFTHIRNVGKYAARLGQCFSTTRSIDRVSAPWIKTIPDIERDGYCFTDGVGKISAYWAAVICDQLKLQTIPSAFQFRMRGCKGVLVVWDDVKGQDIHIRPSQLKFETKHSRLEVIRCSQFSIAALNRQTITVLSSLGVVDDVFEDMLKDQLAKYDEAMHDPDTAFSLLTLHVDPNEMTLMLAQLIAGGLMDSREPFVWTMLRLWRTWSIKYLKEKARIVVEKSAFVLGCVDETGILRGHFTRLQTSARQRPRLNRNMELPQIFLQVPVGPENNYKVITGTCVVGRNPSLHPGDLRVVEAVDVPELRHLKNVVVFAQTGDRDIPSMCSGGDLDGDDYFVFWDDRLLPPGSDRNHKPMNYHTPKAVELERDVTAEDLCKFFVTYMRNSSLGSIAHAHLANADKLPLGVKEPECLQLAELHSLAVDYPKTGVPAKVHCKLLPKEFPHFMEKAHKSSYHSNRILGKLYDQVRPANFQPAYEMPFNAKILNKYGKLDPGMLKRARQLKTEYDQAIRRIMGQREIATEFEVFSAMALSSPRVESQYKQQESVGHEATNLKTAFRDRCMKAVNELLGKQVVSSSTSLRDVDNIGPFVVAMYQVTDEEIRIALHECRSRNAQPSPKTMPLFTFPWIFDNILYHIATGTEVVAGETAKVDPAASSTVVDFEMFQHPSRLHDLTHEDIQNIEYARTRDGRVIHRGVVLGMFQSDDDGYGYSNIDPDLYEDPNKPSETVSEKTPAHHQDDLIDVVEAKSVLSIRQRSAATLPIDALPWDDDEDLISFPTGDKTNSSKPTSPQRPQNLKFNNKSIVTGSAPLQEHEDLPILDSKKILYAMNNGGNAKNDKGDEDDDNDGGQKGQKKEGGGGGDDDDDFHRDVVTVKSNTARTRLMEMFGE